MSPWKLQICASQKFRWLTDIDLDHDIFTELDSETTNQRTLHFRKIKQSIDFFNFEGKVLSRIFLCWMYLLRELNMKGSLVLPVFVLHISMATAALRQLDLLDQHYIY